VVSGAKLATASAERTPDACGPSRMPSRRYSAPETMRKRRAIQSKARWVAR
jgi:hypothetical protein